MRQGNRLAFALATLMAAGCGRSPPPSMDVAEARAAVVAALDAWKDGAPAQRLRERAPAIDFRDLSWDNGASLKKYAVEKEETAGASAKVTVRLHLTEKSGAGRTRVVVYNVDAGPTIVIRPDTLALD